MTRILRWCTVGFMIISTAGYGAWFWYNFHVQAFSTMKALIGLGFGLAWGAAIVNWCRDIKSYKRWDAEEKEFDKHFETLEGILKNPPPFRCPDCGIISHNPHDFRNSYCGFCQAFKR